MSSKDKQAAPGGREGESEEGPGILHAAGRQQVASSKEYGRSGHLYVRLSVPYCTE